MPTTHRLGILLGVTLLFSSCARGSDWPQWRGPTRDGHAPDGAALAALPEAPAVLWRQSAGFGIASPVVSGAFVIYLDAQGDKEVVHAVDRATGQERWTDVLDDVHKDSQSVAGPRCTPLIDGGRVYAQSGRGELHCLSLADGSAVWETSYVKDFGATFIGEKGKAEGATRHGYTATPLVDGEHLIAEVGGPDASVVCFNKADGSVVWKAKVGTPAYASPVVATIGGTPQLVAFMVDGVVGLNPVDGAVLWRHAVKTSLGRHAVTPVVVGDRVIVSSHEVGLIAIKVTSKDGAWSATQAWGAKDLAVNFASPVAVGGYLYGVGPSKNLICVDVATGKAAWTKEGFFTGAPGKAYAGIVAVGQNLLVLTDDGQLVLVAAEPAAYREIGRARVCGKNWCNPAYADGELFLRDEKVVLSLRLGR